MNNHFIQLSGKFNIPDPLELDQRLAIGIEVEVDSASKKSNKNGEFDYTYKCPVTKGELVSKLGKRIKFEKTSHSQKLNARIRMDAEAEGKDPDKEYERLMILVRHHWHIVKELVEKLNEEENGI